MVNRCPRSINELKQINIEVPNSELIVYELLSTLSDDWYFWYSRLWIDEKNQILILGEADFLIFNQNYGFLVLEIKGGGVTFANDKWFTKDANDKVHSIKDPFRQAINSMFFFKRFYEKLAQTHLNKELLLNDKNNFPGIFNYGVIFPDCRFKDKMHLDEIYLKKDMIFDASDIDLQRQWEQSITNNLKSDQSSPIENFLVGLFELQKKRFQKPLPEQVTEFFNQIITPEIKTVFLINRLITYQKDKLDEINQRQDEILNLFSQKKHCIFEGKAGTGKTYIAMKKCVRLYNEGKNVLFLCYNRELMNFVQNYLNNKIRQLKRANHGNIVVMSINKFLLDISKNYLNPEEQKEFTMNFEKNNLKEIREIISNIIENEVLKPKHKFDAIIVDEAQDIEKEFALLLREFLKNKNESIFWIFYDAAQKIFNKNFSITHFGFNENSDCFELSKNLRNVDNIINWIELKTSIKYEIYSGVAGKEVEQEQVETFNLALIQAVRIAFDLFYTFDIDLNQMIVLCDKKLNYLKDNIPLHSNFVQDRKYYYQTYHYNEKFPNKRIFLVEPFQLNDLSKISKQVMSSNILLFNGIGTFKGLERDIVFLIVPDLKNLEDTNRKRELTDSLMRVYIGASRAKFILYVIEYSKI